VPTELVLPCPIVIRARPLDVGVLLTGPRMDAIVAAIVRRTWVPVTARASRTPRPIAAASGVHRSFQDILIMTLPSWRLLAFSTAAAAWASGNRLVMIGRMSTRPDAINRITFWNVP